MTADARFTLAADDTLSAAELEDRLDYLLSPVLSSRRPAAPLAQPLAAAGRALQEFTLRWVEIISRTNHELAYQFAEAAPEALAEFDEAHAETWIIQAMDTYDREGLHAGSEVFRRHGAFAHQSADHVLELKSVAPILERYLRGLAGRALRIEAAPVAWTDTETVYLPPMLARAADREGNFLVYKFLATLLWAQSRYGTYNVDLDAAVQRFGEPARALDWLDFLEALRLEAQLARVLPGLTRDAAHLCTDAGANIAMYGRVRAPGASVHDSLALLDMIDLSQPVPQRAWPGVLRPAAAAATRDARIAREKDALQTALSAMLEVQPATAQGETAESQSGFDASVTTDTDGETQVELRRDGKPLVPPQPLRDLLDSIVQDLGEIPEDYFAPATMPAATGEPEPALPEAATVSVAYEYPEWDFQRGHYRKNWCQLREVTIDNGDPAYVPTTLAKYAPQVVQLRRTFELLRGEDRLMKRTKQGDDIDLDAIVSAYGDMRSGMELSERLFVKRHKAERDLAVMFMVDMSGSTKGWINEAEREALVLLTEALEILGDRYAIYGFSGMTRRRCEIFRVKAFDEAYSEAIQQRIAGIAPQDYTRMGAAIRHLTSLLAQVDARTRLLITLSDGKPDDYSDNYRGQYGIEDTRKALIEAHHAGVRPFCITIDNEARDYLPHMYGAVNWTLVDDVSRLPFKVAEIYRRLTS